MTSDGLLPGVRVLDVGQGISGPYCAKIMAQMGAEVIRLNPQKAKKHGAWGPSPVANHIPKKAACSWP